MKGIGRNLRFWGVHLHKMLLTMVATIAVMLAFFTIMEGGNFMESYGEQVPFYLIILTFMSAFMNALNGMTNQFPMTVSFGSTRKDSFIAMQLVQHVIMIEFLLAFYAWFYFVVFERENPFDSFFVMTAVGIVLLVLGLCNVTSAANLRFGRAIGVIVYLLCIIVIVATVVGLALGGALDLLLNDSSWMDFLAKPWILLAGVLFDGAMILILYAQVRKRDLQFG